jgi:hypothetical protein
MSSQQSLLDWTVKGVSPGGATSSASADPLPEMDLTGGSEDKAPSDDEDDSMPPTIADTTLEDQIAEIQAGLAKAPDADASVPTCSGVETRVAADHLCSTAQPLCGRCGYPVDVFRAQLKSKCKGLYVCNSCNTKQKMLSSMFRFPSDDFKLLPDDQKQAFWRASATMGSSAALKEHVVVTLTASKIERITGKIEGAYLPLSVYKAQGFDEKTIEANCSDVKSHPILGTCYRVNIESVKNEAIWTKVREEVLSALSKQPSAKAPQQGVAITEGVEDPAEEPSSQASSSTSSSSSSSSSKKNKKKHHKSKKSKKHRRHKVDKHILKRASGSKDKPITKNAEHAKKDNQLNEKKVKAAAAAQKLACLKENRKVQTVAQKVVSKLAPVILQLESDVNSKYISKVATFASGAIKDSYKLLNRLHADAKDRLSLNASGDPIPALNAEFEETSKAVKDALQHSAVFRQMAAAAENHFKG